MGFTSNYAQAAMDKVNSDDEPKAMKGGQNATKDKGKREHLKKKREERIKNMTPNDPNF